MSYFVGILNEVGDIFLPDSPQVLSWSNIVFRGIFEPHKNPVKMGESCYR